MYLFNQIVCREISAPSKAKLCCPVKHSLALIVAPYCSFYKQPDVAKSEMCQGEIYCSCSNDVFSWSTGSTVLYFAKEAYTKKK